MHHDIEQLKRDIVQANFGVERAQEKLRHAELAYSNAVKSPNSIKLRHVNAPTVEPQVPTDC